MKVFISYKWEDPDHNIWVERFASDLRSRGIEALLDKWEVRYGESFSDYMTRGINTADAVLFIMTPQSICAAEAAESGGGAVKFEVQLATARRLAGEAFRFIGILRRGDRPAAHLRDFRYADFRKEATYETSLRHLVEDLRGNTEKPPVLIEPSQELRELETFFTPWNKLPLYIASNRAYMTPDLNQKAPTTAIFEKVTISVLLALQRHGVVSQFDPKPVERMNEAETQELVQSPCNIISYASSKINRVTDFMLREIEHSYNITARFVLHSDLGMGLKRSHFPNLGKNAHVDLLWKSMTLKRSSSIDYGLVFRGRPMRNDSRMWWIIAGCGRAASVAGRRMVFDLDWHDVMWPKVGREWPGKSFALVYSVPYSDSEGPNLPSVIDVQWL